MPEQPGLDDRYRDENGQIHRKRGDTEVSTLRQIYGDHFLADFPADATLNTVLQKTGADSLSQLIKNQKPKE